MALIALLSKFRNMSAGQLTPIAILGKILRMWLDFCLAGVQIHGAIADHLVLHELCRFEK